MTDATIPAPAPAKKKKSLIGRLFRIAVVLFLLFIVGLVVLYFFRNDLVRAGVTRGGRYATDQETGLEQADLSFAGGALTLDNFNIHNLQGYTEPKLLTMKHCETIVDSGSLFTHKVVVKSIAIDGLEVTLERNGEKNNLNELMAIIQAKSPAAAPAPAGGGTSATPTSPGKELYIDDVKLTGTKVHIRAKPLFNLDFDLGPIDIKEPTNPDGRPMKIADLIARIILNISQQIINDPRLPADIGKNLKNVQALVNNLGPELNKGVKQFGADLQNLTKDPGKAIQDMTKNGGDLGKGVQDMGKNLQNLNPFGNKDKPATTK